MWWRRSWFSLKGKAGIPGQTEGCPATSIGPRVPPVGSLQQRVRTRLFRARRLLRKALHAKIASGFSEMFPFEGARCARITEAVIARLAGPQWPSDGEA